MSTAPHDRYLLPNAVLSSVQLHLPRDSASLHEKEVMRGTNQTADWSRSILVKRVYERDLALRSICANDIAPFM